MTDSEILDELVKIASYPTDCKMSWGDERWRLAVEATDGLWRGLIQAMDKKRIRLCHGVQPTAELDSHRQLYRTLATLCRCAGISDEPDADGQWWHLLDEIAHLRGVAMENKRIHQLLDECHIGNGTESLVERVRCAVSK